MKKKLINIAIIILFLAGFSLLLYPFISNEWNTYRQSKLMSSYEQVVAQKNEEAPIDYTAEWERAIAYNKALLPHVLPDAFALAASYEEPDPEYMACLNLAGDGMMGYVEIPRIDIKIPIYHTTETKVLEKAAGHLEGSSLPVGGESTHTVISAHRGLPSAALFTDLDKLVEGDHFLISVLDDTLCYEVDQITVVEPSDTDALIVEDGKDYATLLTCTPYGVNSHRLLVRGHRVPYEEEVIVKVEEEKQNVESSLHTNYLLWVIVGLVITAAFIGGLFFREHLLRQRSKRRRDILTEANADNNLEENIDRNEE